LKNFFAYSVLIAKALWYGRLPLVIAFWFFGVIGTFGLGFLISPLSPATGEPSVLNIFLAAIVSLGYQIVISVGIWRSADAYRGDKGYAVAARFVVAGYAVFAVFMLGYVLLMIPLLVTVILNPPFLK
jgi:hypothetical protein